MVHLKVCCFPLPPKCYGSTSPQKRHGDADVLVGVLAQACGDVWVWGCRGAASSPCVLRPGGLEAICDAIHNQTAKRLTRLVHVPPLCLLPHSYGQTEEVSHRVAHLRKKPLHPKWVCMWVSFPENGPNLRAILANLGLLLTEEPIPFPRLVNPERSGVEVVLKAEPPRDVGPWDL